MKITLRFFLLVILSIGCHPMSELPTARISKVEVVKQEIIIKGSGLSQIDRLQIKDGAKIYNIAIVTKTDSQINAQTLANTNLHAAKIKIISF